MFVVMGNFRINVGIINASINGNESTNASEWENLQTNVNDGHNVDDGIIIASTNGNDTFLLTSECVCMVHID